MRKNKYETFNVATVNARSVSKKMDDLACLFDHADVQIACICETWETEKMYKKLEELQELEDVTWVGKKRESGRGGGAAVVVSNTFGSVYRLDVDTADLEIVWAIITPNAKPHIKLVVAAFYSSPTKKYKPLPGELDRHVLDVIDICTTTMRNVHFCVAGDINMDSIGSIFEISSDFEQHVTLPTRGDKILDIIVSELSSTSCIIFPPLSPELDSDGLPSDHSIPRTTHKFPPQAKITIKQ